MAKLLDAARLAGMAGPGDLGGRVTGRFGHGLSLLERADGQRVAGFTGGALGTASARCADLSDGTLAPVAATLAGAGMTQADLALPAALREAEAWASYVDDSAAADMTLSAETDGLKVESGDDSILLARARRSRDRRLRLRGRLGACGRRRRARDARTIRRTDCGITPDVGEHRDAIRPVGVRDATDLAIL
jgi:hypothetical protein